jgi:hypothetical protein
VRIETGAPETHESVLPLDASASPGVATPTPRIPGGSEQGGVMPTTAMFGEQAAAGTADCAAAMSLGMGADSDRRGRYAASMSPLGASYGDALPLPEVPDNTLPAAASYGYPYPGLEPTEAAAGFEDPDYGT